MDWPESLDVVAEKLGFDEDSLELRRDLERERQMRDDISWSTDRKLRAYMVLHGDEVVATAVDIRNSAHTSDPREYTLEDGRIIRHAVFHPKYNKENLRHD